jgi:hypothetical protein
VDKALLQASEEFREKMLHALRECRHKTEQAWQSSIEISTDMTYVFQNDVSIPVTGEQSDIHIKGSIRKKSSIQEKILSWKNGFLALFRRDAKASVR